MKLIGIRSKIIVSLIPFLFLFLNCGQNAQVNETLDLTFIERTSPSKYASLYKWVTHYDSSQTVYARIDPPAGYVISTDSTDKFASWLQHLPLKKAGSPVLLYNGNKKVRQDVHAAVINIDAGTNDLQQCADAVMRLRAEFLYGSGVKDQITFKYTSGDKIPFKKWSEGYRPSVKGNKVNWMKSAAPSTSYPTFKNYLWNVFNYAGSKSLSGEMKPVADFKSIKAGDVLIIGGFPGHAMTVIETAVNPSNGKKVFLLAQSYMPAQEIHIVKNLGDDDLSPWYEIPESDEIETPEWTFLKNNLMRWP